MSGEAPPRPARSVSHASLPNLSKSETVPNIALRSARGRALPRTPCKRANTQNLLQSPDSKKPNGNTVPIEKYNALLEKYEQLSAKHTQQTIYVSALEAMVDEERKKVAMLTRGKDKKASSKSVQSPGVPKHKETLPEKTAASKEHLKRSKEKKDLLRKKQEEARLIRLDDKEQIRRMRILQEILNTEKDYVDVLLLMMRIQVHLVENSCLSLEENKLLFSNVSDLLPIHQNLVKILDERYMSCSDNECWNVSIGDIFVELAQSLSIYAEYINNQDTQGSTVEACAHRKNFVKALTDIPEFDDKKVVLNQLRSYLIAPIQRICKYPLLLRELLQATEDSHSDQQKLQTALQCIQEATMEVNEKKKQFEKLFELQKIEDSLENAKGLQLAVPSRVLIQEGDLMKVSKGKTQERHFFLFNDIIIYGSKSLLKPGKILLKGKIRLETLLVNDTGNTEHKNGFELVRMDHKKKKYIICSKLPGVDGHKEKLLWMTAIEQYADLSRDCGVSQQEETWEPKASAPDKLLKFTSNLVRK